MHGDYMENFKNSLDREKYPQAIEKFDRNKNIFYFYSAITTLQLSVISDKILRFRYGNDGIFEDDFSYAIVKDFSADPAKIEFTQDDQKYILITEAIKCYINKSDKLVSIFNHQGLPVLEDEKGYHWHEEKKWGGNIVVNSKKLQNGENFYGLGDKPTDVNLRGKCLQLWSAYTYGFQKETDPIYKNIPFFMGLHHKIAYGLFFDNSFKSYFDFGHERKDAYSFWAEGGEMNYYFIYGPDLVEVSTTYTNMTGKPELPPLWALGYQQSK